MQSMKEKSDKLIEDEVFKKVNLNAIAIKDEKLKIIRDFLIIFHA